jgi:NodT family efflux transporter outer membrane factor (OMF) lipoprotein
MKAILIFGILLLSSSCESRRERAWPIDLPSQSIENAYQEIEDDPGRFTFVESLSPEWWLLFNDPQLTWLIETALYQNPSLQAAQDRIYKASYLADIEKSYLFPQIGLEADLQRQKLSETGVIPLQSGPTGGSSSVPIQGAGVIPIWYTLYETSVNLTYEIDIWGKRKMAFESALDEMHSREADEAFRRLQISVLVAASYFDLQTAYMRQGVQDALVENLEKRLDLTEQKKNHHLVDETALLEAETALLQAKENLTGTEKEIGLAKNLIHYLIGGDFTEPLAPACALELPRVPLPSDIPLHLIAHRPDVISQIWLIEASSLQVHVAKKQFYPDFNLAGFAGYQTIHWKQLFEPISTYGVVEPSMTLPLYQGGALVANYRRSQVNLDLAIYQYNELVLNAVKEVLDGIVRVQTAGGVLDAAEKQHAHRESIFQLMELKKNNHLASGLDTLQAEGAALMAEDHFIAAAGDSLQASLELIKALGGGYGYD